MSMKVIPEITRKRIRELVAKGKRLDGRAFHEYRPIKIEAGPVEKAEGSAQVSMGLTKVLVGVKVNTGEPFPDTPDEGVLTVNAELVPLASPTFEPGPPNQDSIELARVVDRGIREGKALDLEKLCITPGKRVFIVFADVYVLDYDGNLIDASALAAMIALIQAKMRNYKVVNHELVYEEGYIPLPIQHYPLAVTMVKIDGQLLVDPSLEEEQAMESRITVSVDEEGRICSIQKGVGILSPQDVFEAVRIAKEVSQQQLSYLKGG